MASINTVEDIIEALDADPLLLEALRARIMTRELIDQPDRFERFVETVQQFMDPTDRRLVVLENAVAQLAESHARLAESNARLENAVAGLESAVARLAESHASLENTVERLAESHTRLEQSHFRLERKVDSMRGDHLEMRLQGRIHGLLGSRELYRVRVVRAMYPSGSSPKFLNDVDDAIQDDTITARQYQRLMDTDLIVRGRRRDSAQDVYVALEVSNRLNRDDVDRVVESGEALALVYPSAEIQTAVYGRDISDEHVSRAHTKGVEIFLSR